MHASECLLFIYHTVSYYDMFQESIMPVVMQEQNYKTFRKMRRLSVYLEPGNYFFIGNIFVHKYGQNYDMLKL